MAAEDLYEIKSSESSDEFEAPEVVEPALTTVVADDDEDEVVDDLCRLKESADVE